ncbi:MAG: PTS sugar transporter subunit IIB [Actinomycetota bacterium]
MAQKGVDEPLEVVAVCGVGMGSSLILRMTAEQAFEFLGVRAKVQATDVSSAKGMRPDVILGQGMHTTEFEAAAPVVVTISNFTDVGDLAEKLEGPLRREGWLE